MYFTPLPLGTRVRAPVAGVAAAVWLLLSSPPVSPQEPAPAERDTPERAQASLVVDHPVYLRVRPPPAYREAVRRGFRVPGEEAFRMGHIDRRVFDIARWYPQLATLDDVQGLDTTPYRGDGEFYLEYGTFSVDVDRENNRWSRESR